MKKVIGTVLTILFFSGVVIANTTNVLALTVQECNDLYGSDPISYNDCIANASDADEKTINVIKPTGAIGSINSLISGGVTLILIVAGLVAFVYLLLGGIKWITSGGDSAQVEAARNQVIHAMIGIIVVLAAWGLIMLIQGATGACFGIGCTIELPVFT
ncbi:MAG: seg [Microgenomates group bacterium GW2011_GWC1_41_8]|uniref:Uncharacterized protein n=3 Tax=Candidatus Roizmaniibacteriota TaxID=1752723 RepID=A0A0G1A9M1_9BACT|nr:MAG: hypothetical protein UT85_C0025G0007 [Candidatus Levybacteria bacterium GW2011_GWA2_40_16]KKR72340.1 MAG: hypothetical protein UU14_C0007G0021 [Candidatus Roizmanbacteria bacterium GW2011_GWB1_40_7]KKR91447.1 MAG: hypothetical protein UU41_C0037G0002 [Candidatus Roizmanbacteria bacterium GW2011_GWA1_41_13]KKS22028.1 MAG: hypothetical protein UU78_C0024G0002 [Candidatus Roizmanbacteria bacterium GW2011_GWC2_41_7]KKS23176.1 MAG: seg [Microgenomates group bacterium GW2011_GWC1_41_8]OGK503